jgi:hypothetical protein
MKLLLALLVTLVLRFLVSRLFRYSSPRDKV